MKKYLLGFVAMALAITTSSFTNIANHTGIKTKFATTWYYNGSSSQILDATAYSKTSVPTDCQANGNRPCAIAVDATTTTALQSFLDTKTAPQVTALSAQKRP